MSDPLLMECPMSIRKSLTAARQVWNSPVGPAIFMGGAVLAAVMAVGFSNMFHIGATLGENADIIDSAVPNLVAATHTTPGRARQILDSQWSDFQKVGPLTLGPGARGTTKITWTISPGYSCLRFLDALHRSDALLTHTAIQQDGVRGDGADRKMGCTPSDTFTLTAM